MTKLEQTWRACRVLSRADRSKFLSMLRATYAEERAAVLRRNGGGHGVSGERQRSPHPSP
jgi:hypothetical protein